MIVGYVRSYCENPDSTLVVQKNMIERYCKQCGISQKIHIYQDASITNKRKRNKQKLEIADKIGLSKGVSIMSGWEQMMLDIIAGYVDEILVDCQIRLFSGKEQREVLNRLCVQYNVKITEIGNKFVSNTLVYYESTHTGKRTSIPLKDVDKLYYWCYTQNVIPNLVLKKEGKCNHIIDNINASSMKTILVKNYQHLNRKSVVTLNMLETARKNGVSVKSLQEGEIVSVAQFSESLQALLYDKARSSYEREEQGLIIDILKTFVSCKTQWEIEGVYFDISDSTAQYDIVCNKLEAGNVLVVSSFSKLGKDISMIVKLLKTGAILYSLKEGGLMLHEK